MQLPRPNRSLLNARFDGYKLSSEAGCVDLSSTALPITSHEVPLRDDQFSFLWVQSRATFNHLFLDPFASHGVGDQENGSAHDTCSGAYYINRERNVLAGTINKDSSLTGFHTVFSLSSVANDDNSCPSSLAFPTEHLVAISDGAGCLYLAQTNNRYATERSDWFSPVVVTETKYPFYVVTTFWDATNNELHVLLLSVHEEKRNKNESHSYTLLEWVELRCDGDHSVGTNVVSRRQYRGDALPHLCWFSGAIPGTTQLLIATTKKFHLVSDSAVSMVNGNTTHGEVEEGADEVSSEEAVYSWSQTSELVSLTFPLSGGFSKEQVSCTIGLQKIDVSLCEVSLLSGDLEAAVEVDASRWFISEDRSAVELVLVKKDVGMFWSEVVLGDSRGRHDAEGEEKERVSEMADSLRNIASDADSTMEMDARNFGMQELDTCDEDTTDAVRVYCITTGAPNTTTATASQPRILTNLGNHQWLFSAAPSTPSEPPRICLRHDVDGLLWRMDMSAIGEARWSHVSTFDALGFVQASKREHKFTVCGGLFEFATITDCTRNVYIYARDAHNQTTHRQFIVSLPDAERIIGCQATLDHVFVLTDKHLHQIHISL